MDFTRTQRARWRAARAGVVVAAVAAGSLAYAGLAQAAPSAPLVAVPGSASPGATAHRDSGVDANQQVTVGVSLKLRDAAGLAAFDTAVSTPGNAEYGHYLTAAQFAATYSPTQSQVDQVKQYLTAAGLKVTGVSGNRQVVDASGTASQVGSAFHTTLSNYTSGSKHYRTNDSAVSLPSTVSGLVQGISGLDSRAVAHPQLVAPKATNTPAATPSGYGPSQYDGAYRFNNIGEDGTGITVALWEFDGYTAGDLSTYNSQYGLSGPAATTVSVDGANYDSSPGQGQGEVELDSDIVRGVAPKAAQLVYEAPNSNQGQIDMANQIVSQDKAQVISISWGGCEADQGTSEMTSTDNALSQAVAEGMTIYSASGDNGSADCQSGATGVDYPASSPDVSGAGGTTLSVSGTTWSGETAWSGSGGGVSTVYAKPSWQTSSGTKRTVPDISGNADYPGSPYAIYIAGSWQPVGGTSCVAPLWSGFTALVDQKAKAAGKATMGLINPKLYAAATAAYSANFHDITSGSNGGFSAGPGVDDVTGIGSPIGDTLANTLVGGGSTGGNTVTVTSPGNQNTATGSSVNLTVTGSDSAGAALSWSATGLPTGLSINATSGVISGTATTAGSYSVTVTATDSTGAAGSASFTWTVGNSGGGCTAGQKLGNPGFESGNTVWSASSGVIGQNNSAGEPAHSGSWDAWLDGYGTTHTDTLSQSVTIPAGCSATLSFYVHIDTAETTSSTQYDKLTVKLGSTTLATFSNLNAASGYTQHTYNVSSLAGQTVTLTFTGTEDSQLQTSFVLDDTALNVS